LDSFLVRMLLWERVETRNRSIIVPAHGGRRGHPTLIDWKHVGGMRALPPGEGLNGYLRQHIAETQEVPVDSPDILFDLDTPEDYERLRQSQAESAAESGTFKLFVYGTLMRGGLRHDALRGQQFLREAVTRPKYLLFDMGGHPGLVVADKDGRAVHGELYEVERRLIRPLDMIEGSPESYRLEPVEIEGEAGSVSAYLFQKSTAGLRQIAAGRWRAT